MEVLRYRGRVVTTDDIDEIKELIAQNPSASRRALSGLLCEKWNWRQSNGTLRDMVCRSLMLTLHRAGYIQLPAVRWVNPNPLAHRRKPNLLDVDESPVTCSLGEVATLEFVQVRRNPGEQLFNSLLQAHHYLGYTQPVGEHLKFLVYRGAKPIACFAWSSAPRHLGPRDRFIGWSMSARRANIRFLAYNTRFLVLPWVQVKCLASHLLGRMARLLSCEWERVYSHPIYYLESFIDPERYTGVCYRAANWHFLGQTQGRGKDDLTHLPNRSLKVVLGYPLRRDFRRLLCEEPASSNP
jgi:hypothetical protein